MATASKITIDLETKTQGWTKGLSGSAKEADTWAKDIKSKFSGLTLGSGQNFNAAGFAKFADTLKNVSQGVGEVVTQLRTGKGYGEAFSEAVNKIPIVGQFKQAGEAISEMITGIKAARIEADKWARSTMDIAQAYRGIARERAGFGKYGEEKQTIDIDNTAAAAKDALMVNKYEADKRLAEVRRHDAYIGWYSKAQEDEMKRLRAERRKWEDLGNLEDEKAAQKKLDLKRETAEGEHQFIRNLDNETADIEAKMQEKSLRRQGQGLESAIVGIKEMQRQKIDQLKDSISDFHLQGMNANDAAERRASVAKAIIAIDREAADTIGDLQGAQQHKAEQQFLTHHEKMREIEASAAIERLKMQDEQANALADKQGKAERSHLAERAAIEEEFRKATQDAVIKWKEENPTNGSGWVQDAEMKRQIQAMRAERQNKLDLLDSKSTLEASKNQENSLKEQRRLWEEAGGPAEKYAAHLATINEQYEKFHDAGLQAAQIGKLDRDTLNDLRKANPEHEAKVNLYGRTGSYAGLRVGDAGESIAKQQLESMKRQEQQGDETTRYWRDIWNYLRKLETGPIAELNI